MDPQRNTPTQQPTIEQRLKHSTQKLARILRRREAQKRVPRKSTTPKQL